MAYTAVFEQLLRERDELRAEIEQLKAISQRALDHYDMRSELYTNDSDVAAGMADILRAPLQPKP
jgi:hypothetical protein